MRIYKGDIYYADLSPVIGSEQGGLRPVLVIQNDIGNYYSETTIVAAITSRKGKNTLPTHVPIFCCGLDQSSIVLLEQIRTIDRRRIREYIGHLQPVDIKRVDRAAEISLGLI